MGDVDEFAEAFEEPTKKVRTIPHNITTNVSYMNHGKWKYDASVRNAYVWVSNIGKIRVQSNLVIVSKGDKDKIFEVANIYDGMRLAEEIMNKY